MKLIARSIKEIIGVQTGLLKII